MNAISAGSRRTTSDNHPAWLRVRNHQKQQPVNIRLLSRIIRTYLSEVLDLQQFELAVHIVPTATIVELNETYLRHRGPTDVIAFDYSEGNPESLHGEIFVCLPVAMQQARRFRSSWQSEVVRYVIHGLLHLRGYSDHTNSARQRMKKAEDTALSQLASRFYLDKIGGHSRFACGSQKSHTSRDED